MATSTSVPCVPSAPCCLSLHALLLPCPPSPLFPSAPPPSLPVRLLPRTSSLPLSPAPLFSRPLSSRNWLKQYGPSSQVKPCWHSSNAAASRSSARPRSLVASLEDQGSSRASRSFSESAALHAPGWQKLALTLPVPLPTSSLLLGEESSPSASLPAAFFSLCCSPLTTAPSSRSRTTRFSAEPGT